MLVFAQQQRALLYDDHGVGPHFLNRRSAAMTAVVFAAIKAQSVTEGLRACLQLRPEHSDGAHNHSSGICFAGGWHSWLTAEHGRESIHNPCMLCNYQVPGCQLWLLLAFILIAHRRNRDSQGSLAEQPLRDLLASGWQARRCDRP